VRPQGFSPDVPCATFLTLDPHPGPHGQGLLPELELEPLPSNFPGPLGSYPSVGKSVHPESEEGHGEAGLRAKAPISHCLCSSKHQREGAASQAQLSTPGP
jgi:hypothetical protein